MKAKKLDSRYSDVDTIYHPINDKLGYITSTGAYHRTILNPEETSIEAIDFEGGPMLSVGKDFYGKKIKNISKCVLLELE